MPTKRKTRSDYGTKRPLTTIEESLDAAQHYGDVAAANLKFQKQALAAAIKLSPVTDNRGKLLKKKRAR